MCTIITWDVYATILPVIAEAVHAWVSSLLLLIVQEFKLLPIAFPQYTQQHRNHGYLFERSEQLDADEAQFVASDVLEQEGVVLQVVVGEVVLDLSDQLLGELLIRGLPALLLQLPSTGAGAGTAVCVGGQKASWSAETCLVHH